jgi:hypothetical protein
MAAPEFSAEELRSHLEYDPETGVFIRGAATRKKSLIGLPVHMTETRKGYCKIDVMAGTYFAHRLAWMITYGEWPEGIVDHINGDRKDNRIANLRLADASQNAANSKIYKTNTSGFRGVSERSPGKFRAYVYKDKKMIRLGQFSTAEEAYAAHVAAAKELHGEFFRGESLTRSEAGQ